MNKIKADAGELGRMMKIIGRCLDKRSMIPPNIQLHHKDSVLTIRGTNGTVIGEVSTTVFGGDGDTLCIDGETFGKVVNLARNEMEISWDDKSCIVKGNGKTKLPVVRAKVPALKEIKGKTVTVKADAFRKALSLVSYAIDTSEARQILMGALIETDGSVMRMCALDGSQMAMESVPCEGDAMSAVIPGDFLNLVSSAAVSGEELLIVTDERNVQAKTDSMVLQSPLLVGQFPEYEKVIPRTYTTEILVTTDILRDALKAVNVLNSAINSVKVRISDDEMTVSSNSATIDYESAIPCDMQGDVIESAYNNQYLLNALNAIETDEVSLKFSSAVRPLLVQGKDTQGIHICMPVRLGGAA